MKGFIEKFKQSSTPKKIAFIVAVACIVGMFIYKFVINNTAIQLGIPYLITTIAVYLVKIAIVLLVVKVIFVIINKIKESKK